MLVHEITSGVVYRDPNVTVTAFAVVHGPWDAFGYRFDTADRRIVISGDTAPTHAVVQACDGCDVLLHEVNSPKRKRIADSSEKQAYFKAFHTSPKELGELATRAAQAAGTVPPVARRGSGRESVAAPMTTHKSTTTHTTP